MALVSTRATSQSSPYCVNIGAVFVASAEILEDLVRMKWTKAAKGIVSIVDGKTELLKSEISGPAKEITYIIRARREFQK